MVIFQIKHTVKPEFIDIYKNELMEDARNSILEQGFLRFEVFQDQANPTIFTLLEIYRDLEAREFHLHTHYLLKFREILNEQGMLTHSETNQVSLVFPGESHTL
jgi:quinol monooxygenase YgiN